jgi:hypothetical protein
VAAIERAERMSRNDGYLGAFAFSAIGDPASGFIVADVLVQFGSFK